MVKFGLKIAAFFGRKSSSVVAPKVMQEAFSSGLVKSRNCGLFAKAQQKSSPRCLFPCFTAGGSLAC